MADQRPTRGAARGGPRNLLRRLREVMAGADAAQARLDKVVRIIAADMVAEVCSCYLSRAGDMLELFSTEGLAASAVHTTRLRVGEGLIGHVAAYAKPLNLPDARSHPLFAYRPETGEEIYTSLLGVPILHGGRVVGVLAVQNRASRTYDDEEVEALQTVAMVLAELVAGGDLVDPRELAGSSGAISGPLSIDGLPLVGGVGMGAAIIHRPARIVHDLTADDPAVERARLTVAVASMQADIDRLFAAEDLGGEGAHRDILETYRMFARDTGWLSRIEAAIETGLTAEAAVLRVQEDMNVRLSQVGDPYLRERLHDLEDLAQRLRQHLAGALGGARNPALDADFVVVARNMGPAEFLEYDRRRFRGLIMEEGSPTTHVAIMARAFGVPVIGKVRAATSRIPAGEPVLIDGTRGQVMVRPRELEVETFRDKMALSDVRRALFDTLRDKPARTRDGTDISLNINAGLLVDMEQLDRTGADGVGLFRTEVPFMVAKHFPNVAAQADTYRRILDVAAGRRVVFRTLDIGGDKRLPYMPPVEEQNPAMGWRALRLGLDRPAILRQQLRALIRAADGRPLRIMLPMVADLDEFDAGRRLLDREMARAAAAGAPLPETLKVGAMLEVPALIWQLEALLARVDFLSVGTNDLVQFMFAADRGNPSIAGRYGVLSSSMLVLFRRLAKACDEADVPLSICGEAAGETLQVLALIGAGLRRFSMSPSRLGPVKLMIRSLETGPLRRYIDTIRTSSAPALERSLKNYARDHGIST